MSANKVLVLGPAGTYGHEAVSLFPCLNDAETIFCESNSRILEGVLNGLAKFGVVPVENSTTGFIRETIRFWLRQDGEFFNRSLYVIGEDLLPIGHCLIMQQSNRFAVEIVKSHPEALQQCSAYLRHKNAILQPTVSTAAAAKSLLLEQSNGVAAIASKFAAQVYGLKIIEENIQDFNNNTTRFHLLGTKPSGATGNDKTAVIFWLENKPGSLWQAIEIFSAMRVNITSIHSIPLGAPGEFAFYVEFDGHRNSESGQIILNILGRRTSKMVVLGSFPKAI